MKTYSSGVQHISLKNKLLLAFLLIGIIPSLTLGFMLYKESEETVELLSYESRADLSTMSAIEENLEDLGTIFIKFSLIIITLSIGASIAISYNITFGITRLLTYTKRVEQGDLDFEIETIANDEIGYLTRSFNKMIFRLNRMIDKTYRLELSESEARLKALQAQISPHFLYNALDTINWSLIENGDYKTSATLGALSEILRYSIGDFEKIVTLEEELKHVTNYLKVQQSRFEERLTYEIDIERSILNDPIPKLLLQPIVENAVVHGVEKNKKGGLIRIIGRCVQDHIELTISDNGCGIKEGKLVTLNHRFHEKNRINSVDRTEHIGVVNVYERIQLVYGPESSMVIKSKEGQGTEVIMSLGDIKNL